MNPTRKHELSLTAYLVFKSSISQLSNYPRKKKTKQNKIFFTTNVTTIIDFYLDLPLISFYYLVFIA